MIKPVAAAAQPPNAPSEMVMVAVERQARRCSAFRHRRLTLSQKADTSIKAMGKCVLAPCSLDQMDGSTVTTNYRAAASGESMIASECDVSR